jgi:hypothetical protein
MLRGIRYRSGRSLAVFGLAVLATTAAVLAPAYSRAAQQSVLTDGLRAAPADATSLVVGAKGTAEAEPAAFRSTEELKLTMNQALGAHRTVDQRLDRPVGAADTDVTLTAAGEPLVARLAYRDDACFHLRITGNCPENDGQVLVSKRTADTYHLTAGSVLELRMGSRTSGREHRFQVVGLYTPKDATEAYWGRTVYFPGGVPDPTADAQRVDSIFTMSEDDVRDERSGEVSVRLEYPLSTGSVRLSDAAALRTAIGSLTTELRGEDLDLTTGLPAVLSDVDGDQASIGRTAPVITVPLLLLCWFVLFLLVASLVEERAPEIALAKLRGYPSGRASRFGLGEALLLIAVAAPVGILVGLGLVEVAARGVLAPGTNVEARWPVPAAAAMALLGAGVAAVLAGRRTLARPVLGLLRRVPERTRWQAGAAEGVVVALAGASMVAAASDRTAPLALLAAPLLAVVAGIATARVLNIWARLRLRGARRRGRLATLLATAQLSRRPGGQRVVVVVTVAVALLSFAATAWDVAAQARRDHAADVLGAARVYTVAAEHPTALSTVVNRVDPDGHTMAVVRTSQRYGESSVELIGVQAALLPKIAIWRGEDRSALNDLAALLHPQVASPLVLGAEVTVEVSTDAVPARVPLRLAAVVGAAGEPPRTIPLGVLAKGVHDYRASLPACDNGRAGGADGTGGRIGGADGDGGCHLIGIGIGRANGGSEPVSTNLSIMAIRSGSGDLPASLAAAGRWRAAPSHAQVTVKPGTAMGIEMSSTDPGDVVVEYVDTPDELPAVLAGTAPNDDVNARSFRFPGFAEQPQPFRVAARTGVLPRTGAHGLLFDLDYAVRMAERSSSLADNDTLRYEVWAGPDAPADLPARLASGGVSILRTETMDSYLDQLSRRAPALGLWLYLLAGTAAIALAMGVVLLTAYVGVQGRGYELAALRVAGVPAKVLRRSVLREYRSLLFLPVLVGFVAGIAGALVMLPGIPLVTVGTPAGAIDYRPGIGALPVAAVVVVLALGGAILLVLRTMHRATPDRLREGPGS